MRKKVLFSVLLGGLVAFMGAGVASAAGMEYGKTMESGKKAEYGKTIDLKLSAFGEAKTGAKGDARFVESRDGQALHYAIDVAGLKDVTMAHIHEIVNGKPGAILVWLYPYPGAKPIEWDGAFKGPLAAGVITKDNFEGTAKGKTVTDLFEMLSTGKAAVAVHTRENPDGELVAISSARHPKHM